jgi:cell division protein FtsI/penicillin-binding protein 2
MFINILLQFNPSQWFSASPLERYPAALSLIYLGGMSFVAFLLLMFVIFNRKRKSPLAAEADANLPDEVRKRLGSRSANRALWIFRVVFVAFAIAIFGFHVYWAMYAAQKDPRFEVLSKRDIRVKRAGVSDLRGWILDRSGDINTAFAFWRIEKRKDDKGQTDEKLVREMPMDREMAHLLGTSFGTPGLEGSLFKHKDSDPTPEAIEVVSQTQPKKDEAKDVRLTLDRDLQKFAFDQLKDKRGAIVVLNPQNGEVLAIASNPTFSLSEARTLDQYRALDENIKDKPLVSRALGEYYVPGSTFKTFTMMTAFRAGRQNEILTSQPGGYAPYRNSRPITDANGGCEPPFGCAPLDIGQAFEASSNQYFSQLAVVLERNRLRETAKLLGIDAVEDPEDATTVGFFPEIWNASSDEVKKAVAPRQSAIVMGSKITTYDLAIQGMGQGYAGQMTPFQMALLAATAANLEGKLMKPKIEMERAPEVYSQVLTQQQAADIRNIMVRVTEGTGGTAHVVPRIVGADIRVGGKTGTAQKQVPIFDKDGKVKTITIKHRNRKTGEITEIKRTVLEKRVDGWFICFAPLENPQVAMAVIIENIGVRAAGGSTAAPIAANLINKARERGLLGENYRPKTLPNVPKNPKTSNKATTKKPR